MFRRMVSLGLLKAFKKSGLLIVRDFFVILLVI